MFDGLPTLDRRTLLRKSNFVLHNQEVLISPNKSIYILPHREIWLKVFVAFYHPKSNKCIFHNKSFFSHNCKSFKFFSSNFIAADGREDPYKKTCSNIVQLSTLSEISIRASFLKFN